MDQHTQMLRRSPSATVSAPSTPRSSFSASDSVELGEPLHTGHAHVEVQVPSTTWDHNGDGHTSFYADTFSTSPSTVSTSSNTAQHNPRFLFPNTSNSASQMHRMQAYTSRLAPQFLLDLPDDDDTESLVSVKQEFTVPIPTPVFMPDGRITRFRFVADDPGDFRRQLLESFLFRDWNAQIRFFQDVFVGKPLVHGVMITLPPRVHEQWLQAWNFMIAMGRNPLYQEKYSVLGTDVGFSDVFIGNCVVFE